MESTKNKKLVKSVKSKKTLAAQKVKLSCKVKRMRNVILNPTQKFWPCLNDTENNEIYSVMKSTIDYLAERNEKMSKETNYVTSGINETAAQKDKMWAVLLEDDVHPKFLIQHMINLCVNSGIIVLIVRSLRELSCKLFGFPSIVVGFKKEGLAIVENSDYTCPLYQVYEVIKKLGKSYIPPRSYCYYSEPVSEPSESETREAEKEKFDKSKDVTNFYLLKPKCGRAFIPEALNKEIETQSCSEELEKKSRKRPANDYISLSAGITSDDFEGSIGRDTEDKDVPLGISCSIVRNSSNIVQENEISENLEASSSMFIPLKYVQVQPKPKKKKIS